MVNAKVKVISNTWRKERGTWDYKNMMGGTSYLVCYFLGQGSTKTSPPKTLHWETYHSLNAQKERQDWNLLVMFDSKFVLCVDFKDFCHWRWGKYKPLPSPWLTGWPPIIQTSPFKNALMPRKVIAMIMVVVMMTTNKVLYDDSLWVLIITSFKTLAA